MSAQADVIAPCQVTRRAMLPNILLEVLEWGDVHQDHPTVFCCFTFRTSLGTRGCCWLLIRKWEPGDDSRYPRHKWRCWTKHRRIHWCSRRWRGLKHLRKYRRRDHVKQCWWNCGNGRHVSGHRWRAHSRRSWRRGHERSNRRHDEHHGWRKHRRNHRRSCRRHYRQHGWRGHRRRNRRHGRKQQRHRRRDHRRRKDRRRLGQQRDWGRGHWWRKDRRHLGK